MNFLADESCAGPVIQALREAGHDVVAIAEVARGTVDELVMRRALSEKTSVSSRMMFRMPWKRTALPHPGHNGAQDVIDAGGIAISIFPEPVVDVAIQASGHQHFGSAAELRQLLVRQWRNIRIV